MFYNKLIESRNYINNSIYSLFYAKLEISFILEKSGPAKTGPAGPVPMPLVRSERFVSSCHAFVCISTKLEYST